MSKRCDNTVFLVTDRRVFRADFSGRGNAKLLGQSSCDLRAETGLAEAVLLPESKYLLGRKVLVLSTNIWTQVIGLPAASVRGISDDELCNALRFEIESLCGIDADKSTIGFQTLNESSHESRFRVVATESFEFDALSKVLTDKGATQIYLSHPAGADLALGASDSRIIRSVQLWPNLAASFTGSSMDKVSVAADNALRWREDLAISDEEIKTGKTTILSGLVPQDNGEDTTSSIILFDDSDSSAIENWFENVGNVFASSESVVAIAQLRHDKRPKNQLLLRTALVAVAIGFCAWHWNWMNQKQSQIQSDYKAILKPGIEKKNNDAQLAKLIEQQKSIAEDTLVAQQQLKKIDLLLNHQSDRLVKLLELIVQHRTEDIKVESVTPNEFGLVIGGISLSSDSPQNLANKLRPETEDLGWKVSPATQNGQRKMTSGGPWDFEILLEDVKPIQKIETADLGEPSDQH